MKNSINLITHETIGDKIRTINLIKNNTKIIIKYFVDTEINIDEFVKKIDLDLNNLFDSFNDDKIYYQEEWIDNIITNIDNYTVNFNDYFTTNDNTNIKVNWIKSENKYILQIYPDVDNLQLILNTIKNNKKLLNKLQEDNDILLKELN